MVFTTLLQTAALALSIFNLITFLWLAFTVWLNGDRQSVIARVGFVGLSFAALFFFIQASLIRGPFNQTANLALTDFLWHLIWLPAVGVPYIWFIIGLHYAALINQQWRTRRSLLLTLAALLGCNVLISLAFNRSTYTFRDTILLLGHGYVQENMHPDPVRSLLLVSVLFLFYVAFCAIGPWLTPGRIGRLLHVLWLACTGHKRDIPLSRSLMDAFWNDQASIDQLEEPALSWYQARPGLLVAALLMVCLTVSLGVLVVFVILHWLELDGSSTAPAMLDTLPSTLVMLDIYATGSVALIVLLIGYSIVRHGILIERPLARRGFFEQWRGIVIMATTMAIFIAFLAEFTRSSLGGMLLITSIATGTYALFTWSSYTAHDRYIALLAPFLHSTNVRHWLNTDPQKTEQSMEALFSHLCKDVIEVQCAVLVVLAGPMRRKFNYCWPTPDWPNGAMEQTQLDQRSYETHLGDQLMQGQQTRCFYRMRMTLRGTSVICWVLPLYDELGLVANLYLGPRKDGSVFTNEDMDLAQVCGQRILDTLRDHEAMLTVASLLRRRIVDVKLLGAQQRRVLHDEILPMLHLALLHMETLRAQPVDEQVHARTDQALENAIVSISDAHRRLAAMMRAMSTSAPHRLERDGLMSAIHTMLVQDFQHSFDEVEWQVSNEMASHIDEVIPPATAELVFAAVQEALRNAARHARGSDVHRRLRLTFEARCNAHLEVIVADDGIGLLSTSSSTTGTGSGLLTHSALLAIAGGSLTVKSVPGNGVRVRIFLPIESIG